MTSKIQEFFDDWTSKKPISLDQFIWTGKKKLYAGTEDKGIQQEEYISQQLG